MRILTTEPLSSINEEFRETLLQFTINDNLHEFIDTVSILNIDGLHYLPDWTPVLNSIDNYLEKTIQDNRSSLFQISVSAMDCDEGSRIEDKLLKILRFTSNLLRLSFAKDIYNSLEHILVLTSAVNQNIACEAVNCIYSLALFPDIHHSVIMEDRHMTALQKNQPYYWQIFQILECIFPFIPRPSDLFSDDSEVSPSSLLITLEPLSGLSFSQSALSLALPEEKQSEKGDSLNIFVSGENLQTDLSKVSNQVDSRFSALWALRGSYWSSSKAGKMRLMTIAYQLCYVIFTSYPDYTAVVNFFVDKVQLLKDFVELVASVTYDGQPQEPEMLELRILACFCIASLLDTKDQSSNPLGLQYPWLFQELGVNRGQFMGLMPSLLRSCCLSLSSIRSDITKRFNGNVMSNSDLSLGELHAYRWGERLIILVYYLCNLNNSLPAFLENGLISLMLGLVNKSEEAMFPFQMWIDNMALTILESVMTPNTSVHTAFRDFDGPDIVLRRMQSALTAFITAAKGDLLPPSQTLLIQQFISLTSCYMQESRADGDEGQASLLYRNSNLNAALHLIFDNASQMHPSVLSASTALMAEIMNRDLSPPSIVNWMVQQDLPRKAFLILQQRPSIANCDLPLAVIGLASAISLTADGIKVVQESKALQLTLEYFGDSQNFLPYSTNLMTDQASSLGAALEELLRHYPVFVEPVLQTLIQIVGNVHERAEDIRKSVAHTFSFEDSTYNFNPAYSALMHCGVACACCLEPILSRNLSATTFMQMNGFQALMKLKDVSLGTAHQFLVGASCALEGSSTSLGYSVLVATVTRCVFQLVDSSPSVLLLTLISSMTDVMNTLESTFESYRSRYCPDETRDSLFYGFIDTICSKPFHLIEKNRESQSQVLVFAQCLMCLANLDFLYEVFGSLQGGRNSRHANPADLLSEEVKSKFSVLFNRGMQNIYIPSQGEMSRYRTKKRISGLSTAAVTEQPVFLLMITSDFAIFRETIEDSSKRTGKMLRGTFVEAIERKCGSNGLVRYRTKYGWVGQTKGSTLLEPQVMIVDIREKKSTENISEPAHEASPRSVQSLYDVDKYSNVSLRRAALFSFFSHHVNTRNSVIGTFLRVFGAKDPTSSLLATSKVQTKEFLSSYFPTVRSTLMALLPPLSQEYPEFNTETFLSGLKEDAINIGSSDNWISRFSFPMPAVGLDKFDLDTILMASRSMELFRTLLFESKKPKAPSPFMISMLTNLIKTSTYIDDLLMVTSLILQAAMTLTPATSNSLNNSAPGEPQLLLERKLMALSTLDLAIDLWKQLLISFVMPSDSSGYKEISSRLVFSMIRAFYPVWANENFHFLPASIARGVLEMIGFLSKGIADFSVEAEKNVLDQLKIRRTERRAPSRPVRFQPDATAVQTCVDMGFDEQSVRRAMRALRSSDVSLVVPYIVETPFGEMIADDAAEMNEDEAADGEAADISTQAVVVPPLLRIDAPTSAEELKPLPSTKIFAEALQPGLYSLTRLFMIRMIKSGAIPSEWVLDADLLSSGSHMERSVFTVSILNSTIKAIENFSWTETSMKLLLIRWVAAEAIQILLSEIDTAGANALYGLLHSISVLMSCRIVNSHHFRQFPASPEYFILTLNFDPQFSMFQSLLVKKLRMFYCTGDKVSVNDKWITPALMVLGNLNQPVLCSMSIDSFVADLKRIIEQNPGKIRSLDALLYTPDRLVCEEVKKKIEEYSATNANRSLPLLESSLTTEEKKHAAEFALKILSWLDSEQTATEVSEDNKQFIGNTARASLQFLVHLLADSSVRDFCQQEKILSTIFSLKVTFEGMHQIVFSVLQRFMEADSYLKPTMKVILKLIFDRLTMKSETSLSLKTFTDVASPLLYRNQSMFLEELQEVFTLENPVGNSIVLKPKREGHGNELSQVSNGVAPSSASKNPRSSSANEDTTDMHVAKRMRTDRTSLTTKVEDSTPLKRRADSHGSSFSRGALLVEYIVSELVSKWANIMDIAKNTSSKVKSRSLFSISELFLILADLVASFPSVVTCIQRSRIREEHLGEHADSFLINSSSEFNFLSFVLEKILLGSFFELLNSKELKTKNNAEETLESCFYFLAAVVSRPGEGRMSLFSHIKSHLQTLATAPQSMSIIRISDLLMSFLQPPSKWASRELFILPAKDITTALMACNIHTELISLFNALSSWSNLDEKTLQAVAVLVDILVKRAIPVAVTSLDTRRSQDSQSSASLVALTAEATGGDNIRRMNTNSSENQPPAAAFSVNMAPGINRERETNALQEFHEQLLFPTEPQSNIHEVVLDDDNDSQTRSESGQHRIHDINQFYEEDRDDDNHHHLDDDDDEDDDDDDDDIDMDEDDDDHDPDDIAMLGGHHHHHHHEDVIMDDDEDEDDDQSEGTNPSRRSEASSMHHEDDHADHEHEMDMINDDDDEGEDEGDMEMEEILDEDDNEDDFDEDEHDTDEDDAVEDMMGENDDHDHREGDEDAFDEDDDGNEQFDGDLEDENDQQENSEGDDQPHEESFVNNVGGTGGEGLEEQEHDADGAHHMPRFGRRAPTDDLDEDETDYPWDDVTTAVQRFDDADGMGAIRQQRSRHRGQHNRASTGMQMSMMPTLPRGHSASVHIRLGHMDESSNAVEFSEAMPMSDFQELFSGILPEHLLQGRGTALAREPNVEIDISRMMQNHHSHSHHQQLSTASQLRPHPLMEAVDSRRSRPANNLSGSSSISLAFGIMLGQGSLTRDVPFLSYESQMKQQRSQMPPRRKTLGPLVSDRRWGTDLNDLDLPCSRPTDLHLAVERYLLDKVFGVVDSSSSNRARLFRSSSALPALLRMHRRDRTSPTGRSGTFPQLSFGSGDSSLPSMSRASMIPAFFDFSQLLSIPGVRTEETKEEDGEPLIESKEDEPPATSAAPTAPTTISSSSSSQPNPTSSTAAEPPAPSSSTAPQPSPTMDSNDHMDDSSGEDEEIDEVVDEGDEGDELEVEEMDTSDAGEHSEEDDDDEEGVDGDAVMDEDDEDDDDDDDENRDNQHVDLNEADSHAANNENMHFLNSVPPDLRTEILLTAEQGFLSTLPLAVQEEARAIRESHAMQYQMFNFNHQEQTAAPTIATESAPVVAAASTITASTADEAPTPQIMNNEATAASAATTSTSNEVTANPPTTSATATNSSATENRSMIYPRSGTPAESLLALARNNRAPAVNTNAWFMPWVGNVSCKELSFDGTLVVSVMQWIMRSKNDKLVGKFRLLATMTTFEVCRNDILRILLGMMLLREDIIYNAVISVSTKIATGSSLTEADQQHLSVICSNICKELSKDTDSYRRLLNALVQVIKRTGYLAILELFENNTENNTTSATNISVFQMLLQCLRRPNMSTVDIDRTLQVIERACKHFAKLSTEQANQLVKIQQTVTASNGDETLSSVPSQSEPAATTATSGTEQSQLTVSDPLPASNSMASLQSVDDSRRTAIPSTGMRMYGLHNHTHSQKQDKPKRRITYPELTAAEIAILVDCYIASDCGGISKKIFHKIFRYLSLTDSNWRRFLSALADHASELVSLSTVQFEHLNQALGEALQQQEDIMTVMCRPEFTGPSRSMTPGESEPLSQVLQEAKLLGALKLMTMLRSRSTPAASTESEIIATYLRGIPTSDLWELLCVCLDKVAAIEELELVRDARRKGRARTLSVGSPSASANALDTVGATSTRSTPSTSSSSTGNKPISTLTMRFVPLIEFFLSTFSRTLITTPPAASSHAAAPASNSSSSHGVELVRMNSNALVPGSRFRQSTAFLSTQLEIEEDSAAGKLVRFSEQHHELLNNVLRSNIHLLETTFSPLVNVTKLRALLHFDIKRAFFKSKMKKLRATSARSFGGSLRITVRRQHIFEDSFQSLRYKSADEMRRRLVVSFHNEEGVDAGGLTREWYNVLAREIFNANYALFLSCGDGVTFQPNPHSGVNTDHLFYFKFVGRVFGKAICDGFLLDAHFTRSFYKHILGLPVTLQDLEAIEPEYYKSLQQLLDTPLEYLGLDLTFSAETNDFGAVTVTDLLPGGRDIAVNDDNKHEYVRLLAHHRMTTAIRKQIDSFLEGFHELIPAELISIFDASELELLISGLPEIDLDDMRANTEYAGGYKSSDPIVSWFWSVLRSFSKEEKALFLQFVTGTSKVPLDGFKALYGSDGLRKFSICKAFGGDSKLPAAHTCFNQLDLPEYSSEDKLREKLLIAIREGSEGFGFA